MDGDCLANFTCTNHRCMPAPVEGCTTDALCQAAFSGWATECTTNVDCPGQLCVDIGGGAGRCAMAPNPGIFECVAMAMAERQLPQLEDGAMVTVCGNDTALCHAAGYCYNPCVDDGGCSFTPQTPHCNAGTGFCECTADSCTVNASVCDAGVCKCAADADCTTGTVDTCYEGSCGCSAATVCTDAALHPGTTLVCEGF